MNLIKCFQTSSLWYTSAVRGSKPVGVLWHDTYGGNPELRRYVQPSDDAPDREEMLKLLGKNKYNNDWNHIKHEAGLNAWIGKLADGSVATVQAGEWDIHPWGCGNGKMGSCNGYIFVDGKKVWVDKHWIQFEICDDGYKSQDYFKQVYKEACEFTAYICEMFNIDPMGTTELGGVQVPTILCHGDSYTYKVGGNHSDVYKWFKAMGIPQNMNQVRKDVSDLLNKNTSSNTVNYEQFVEGALVSIAPGAKYYSGKDVPAWVNNTRWYVYQDATSDRVVLNDSEDGKSHIMSAFNAKDLTVVNIVGKEEIKQEEPTKEPEVTPPKVEEDVIVPEQPDVVEPDVTEPETPTVDTSKTEDPTEPEVDLPKEEDPVITVTVKESWLKNLIEMLIQWLQDLFNPNRGEKQ